MSAALRMLVVGILPFMLTYLSATNVRAMALSTEEHKGVTYCWLLDSEAHDGPIKRSTECPYRTELITHAEIEDGAPLRAGEPILAIWTAQMVNGLPGGSARDRISYRTLLRACSSVDNCAPRDTAIEEGLVLRNQSVPASLVPMTFRPPHGLVLKQPGKYVLSAQFELQIPSRPQFTFVFATFRSVQVVAKQQSDWRQDKVTTYCRASAQSSLDGRLDVENSLQTSSSCQLGLHVTSADVVQVGGEMDVQVRVVPEQASSASHMGEGYDIRLVMVKLCAPQVICDEYTNSSDLVYEDSVRATLSAGDEDPELTYAFRGIELSKPGVYNGLAQAVSNGDIVASRLDFMTHFQVVATSTDIGKKVLEQSLEADGSTSYCWVVAGVNSSVQASDGRPDLPLDHVVAFGSSSACPVEMSVQISPEGVVVKDKRISVAGQVQRRPQTSPSEFEAFDLTKAIPVGTVVHTCYETLCAPYETTKSTDVNDVIDIATMSNFSSDGSATFSSQLGSLSKLGKHTLGVHAILVHGNFHLLTSQFKAIDVSESSDGDQGGTTDEMNNQSEDSGNNSIAVIVGIIAAVALVAAGGFVWVRRRRQNSRRPSKFGDGIDGGGDADQDEVTKPRADGVSLRSVSSGSFVCIKPERSPINIHDERAGSLSYDPCFPPSFPAVMEESPNYAFSLDGYCMQPPSLSPADDPLGTPQSGPDFHQLKQ